MAVYRIPTGLLFFNNKLISYREVLTFMDLFFNKILFDYERRNDSF